MKICNLLYSLIVLSIFLTLPNTTLAQSLVSEHCFNGNAQDQTSNGNDAVTNSATLTTNRFGDTNSAYSFNGINQSITLPHQQYFNLDEFSYSLWVNVAQNPSSGSASCVLQVSGPPMDQTILLTNSYIGRTGWVFSSYDDFIAPNPDHPDVAKSSTLPQVNTWYHLVCTRGKNAVKLYIDGMLVDSNAIVNPNAGYSTTDKYVALGNRNQGIQYFNGSIDDLAIYSEELDAAQIDTLFKKKSCATPNSNDTSDTSVTVSHIELVNTQSLTIYPNPSSGKVYLEFEAVVKDVSIRIVDVTGKLVSQQVISNSESYEIELREKPGVYFIQVFREGVLLKNEKLLLY